jgi:hypothetical protein
MRFTHRALALLVGVGVVALLPGCGWGDGRTIVYVGDGDGGDGGGGGGGGGGPPGESDLVSLVVSHGTLSPTFDSGTTLYLVGPQILPETVTLTATAADPAATITLDGAPTPSGVASDPIALPVGLRLVTIHVTAADGVKETSYGVALYRAGPQAQEAYVKTSNSEAHDAERDDLYDDEERGSSVALDGDTMVVGAPFEDGAATGVDGDAADDSATDSGAAYVFVRTGATWTQQAYLKASNTGAGDLFGWSVSVSGDTIVVGAPGEASAATGVDGDGTDDSAAYSGAAYVFVRAGGTWTHQAYLKASNTGYLDGFGRSVSVSGETVVVGAMREASDATGIGGDEANDDAYAAGAAYVFLRTGTSWSQQAYLKASNAASNDEFGTGVAVSGDTIVVGAPGEASASTQIDGDQADDTAYASGAAYVFVRSGGTWSQQAYLKASNSDEGWFFGGSVAVSGDRIVVAARGEPGYGVGVDDFEARSGLAGAGAAYVFGRTAGTWTQEAYLKPSATPYVDPEAGIGGFAFGASVSISGGTVVVGAPDENSASTGVDGNDANLEAPGSGAAYVFEVDADGWHPVSYLKASNTKAVFGPYVDHGVDAFGFCVAVSGDTVVVGAPGEDSGATGVDGDQDDETALGSGAFYVFR